MRDESRDQLDRVVQGLARLSLIGVLALMAALFVGSAAAGGTDAASTTNRQHAEPSQEGVLDDASPVGLIIGVVVLGGGLVVLMVGAFKPPSIAEQCVPGRAGIRPRER